MRMNHDAPGQDKVDKWEENEPDYEEMGMDIDEEGTGQGDFESERDELDDRGSEFDEWKEFDEAAEAGFLEDLSDSDMLSELDEMLELDDLAMDGDEAEGWANRQYSFGTDMSRHTYTEKGCDTQEDERHSDLIFDIFDANLWVYFRKPQEGVLLFIHVTLSSPGRNFNVGHVCRSLNELEQISSRTSLPYID